MPKLERNSSVEHNVQNICHVFKEKINSRNREHNIGEYQAGFRKGRSVIGQIYTLRELQARSLEYQTETHILFRLMRTYDDHNYYMH